MNKKMLESQMKLNGDTAGTLSDIIGISRQTFSLKINDKGSEFTQSEISSIKGRYKLTPEQIDNIFFTQQVSC